MLKLFSIHSLSALIAGLLPFRTGEVSFVFLLRKYCTVSGSRALSILVSVRYFEYIYFLLLIFFLSVIGIYISPTKLNLAVFSMIAINLVIILMITWKADWALSIFNRILEKAFILFLSKSNSDSFLSKIEHFVQNLKGVFSTSISKKMLIMTLLIILLRQAFIIFMLRGMGTLISLWLVILLFAFLYAVKFIQGFGSFGSQETGITAALVLVGYSQNESLTIAIGTHLLQWAPILIFGLIGYIFINLFYGYNSRGNAPQK